MLVPGDFTDLLAWQEASALVEDIHEFVRHMRGVGTVEAAKQLLSATESISSNIAEGYGRGLTRDYCRFLKIAIGSAMEVETRVHNAVRSRKVPAELAQAPIKRVRRTRALTVGLLHWVERQLKTG